MNAGIIKWDNLFISSLIDITTYDQQTRLHHALSSSSSVYDFPEEAVAEVKRQAVAELQKAVAVAESKAAELVAAERSKMDGAIDKARKQAADEVMARLNHQEESSEVRAGEKWH